MKICVICDVLGSENNGTAIAAMNLIRTMRSKGHEVRVVCPDAEREGQEGFYIVPCYKFGIFEDYVRKNDVVIAKKDEHVLAQALSGVDVVHVMIPFSLGKAGALMAKHMDIALTAGFHCQAENVTEHVHLPSTRLSRSTAYHIFYDRLYKYCDLIHFPTQFIRDEFEHFVGETPGRVISNGVNSIFTPASEKKPPSDRFELLYTARYSPEKTHDVLIKAIALSRHRDKIHLTLAGNGPRQEHIQKLARELNIPMPEMRFFARDEMLNVIRTSDLYVHAAKIEIESIACLEAISCGIVPLIANSPLSASRYFALGENNLFKYDDPKDCAEKIDYWLDNPYERARCAKQYEGFSERFAFDKCMDEMERLLMDAIGLHKNGK